VTGGGQTARRYIRVARESGADESTCDQIGIEISRLNAYLLISTMGDLAYPEIPPTIKDLKRFFHSQKVIVMGGLTPGHSTTAVGAISAETVRADCYVIASDVEGIYTSDPKVNKEAKKLDTITTTEILNMVYKRRLWAGTYELDPVAVKIIERSRIPTYFISGLNPKNVERVISGEKIGTYIRTPEK